MSDAAAVHPSQQELAAFGLGKLRRPRAEAVAEHLRGCDACRRLVEGLPPDSFVGLVKAAHQRPAPAPAESRPGSAGPAEPPGPVAGLPPELAAHPKFRVLRLLGRGGMGTVYQARHTFLDRDVALKVINPALVDHPEAVERFRAEVKALARLSHPHFVQALDAEQAGSLHLLVMEFVDGVSLDRLLERSGPRPVDQACRLIAQAAAGLQHAHEQGMVHRDLKPQNLMVTKEGKVKVLDLGLTRLAGGRPGRGLTQADAFMGTPEYVAPEQAADARSADIRSDVYSLGCTLYCLLAGRPPFVEPTAVKAILAHIEKEPEPLPRLRPDVPEALWGVVARMLAKDPGQRYQAPIEVARALAPFCRPGARRDAGGGPPPLPGVGSPSRGTAVAADTSKLQAVLREVPGKTPAGEAPGKDETANPFDGLGEEAAPPKKARPPRRAAKPAPAAWWKRPAVLGGAAAVAVALVMVAVWVAGVLRVTTKDGTIVLENLPAGAEVLVDGERVTVTWGGDGKRAEVRVGRGKHQVVVTKGRVTVIGEEVEVEDGGRKVLTARLEQPAKRPPRGGAKPPEDKPAGFVPLFNGKDLTGWKTHPKQPGNWRVEKGVLIGSGPDDSYLYTERGDYKNYHLRVEARINKGDSGVFFRSGFGPAWPASNPRWPAAYEAQINSTYKDAKTGSLFVQNGPGSPRGISVTETQIPAGQWFVMEVIAEGDHLVIKVDGKTTADYSDEKRTFVGGHIALQKNDHVGGQKNETQTVCEFRKLEIKELPPATSSLPSRSANPVVVMETSMGTIKIELFEDKVPATVKNFLAYVDDKFYDGTIFHRVIGRPYAKKDFMIQGGGFEKGLKEPSDIRTKQKKTKKPIKNEARTSKLSNEKYTLAMARTGDPDSATAQFFINVADNKFLDPDPDDPDSAGYAVFGKVIEGKDVVEKIKAVKTRKLIPRVFEDVPVDEVVIKSVRRADK